MLGALSTTRLIAAITLRRLLRGRALWVGGVVAALPIAFAALLHQSESRTAGTIVDVTMFETLVLAVLPALFVASSIGEEIEDRTTTYLWSRPIPRWAILVGKLCALVPVIAALVLPSWLLAMQVGVETLPSAASFGGFALGALALSIVAAAIATLVPKHGMALTICYMLFFDLPVGALPASLRELSVTHHVRVIADMLDRTEETAGLAVLGCLLIGAFWLAIGLLRIRRLEA
jgi:ABC-type transport system involved in multi-copper enzyme maturation permease subunit